MQISLKMKSVAGAVSALILPGAVQAETYLGAQANMMRIDRGAVSDAELTGLTLRAGMVFHELVSGEVRLGKAPDEDTYRGITVENDVYYGVYARLTPPVPWAVAPYLVGGYSYVENEFDDEMVRDDGAGFGGGVDMGVSDSMTVNLEYLRLIDNDFGKQELMGLGVSYFF